MTPWMDWIQIVAGIIICTFLGGLGVILLVKIATDKIDLQFLVSEADGDASMSRFQLLVFTFVIATSFFLVVVGNGKTKPEFPPTVPAGVLTLLGISASSYLVSKGIQASTDVTPAVLVSPAVARLLIGSSQTFQAQVTGLDPGTVSWSVIPPAAGTITAGGVFTPTAVGSATIVATSTINPSISGTALVTVA